jgi:hypothetical protein
MKLNFILEQMLPMFQRRDLMIEYEIISLFSNAPSCNHE